MQRNIFRSLLVGAVALVLAACQPGIESPRQAVATAEVGFTAAVATFNRALDLTDEEGEPVISNDEAVIGLRAAEAGDLALDAAQSSLSSFEDTGNIDYYGAIFSALGEVLSNQEQLNFIVEGE